MSSYSSNFDDYEIKRTVWESQVPVEFMIEDADLGIIRRISQSSYVMLPRGGYFSLYLSKAQLQFLAQFENIGTEGTVLASEIIKDIWLQFNGEPLRWNYPIGVLYDMYSNDDSSLPWLIKIRFKNFPNELIRCSSKDTLKNCFFQTLKEADQLKHKGRIANSLTAEEYNRLFDALCHNNFDDFWEVNKKFMTIEDEYNKFIFVPIRFYQHLFPFRQLLLKSKKPIFKSDSLDDSKQIETEDVLLKDAILKAYPDLENLIEENIFWAISHGIRLPFNTPLIWLARNLSYPDNFVHIVLRKHENLD